MLFGASRRELLKAGVGMVGVGTGAGAVYRTQRRNESQSEENPTNNEFQRAARDMAVKNRDKYAKAQEQFSRGYWADYAQEEATKAMEVFLPGYRDVTIDILDLATKTNPGSTGTTLLDGMESSARVLSALHYANVEAFIEDANTSDVVTSFEQLEENSKRIEEQENGTGVYEDRRRYLKQAYRALVLLAGENEDWWSPLDFNNQQLRQSAYTEVRRLMEIHRMVLYVDYQTTQSLLQNEPATQTLPEAANMRFSNRDINAINKGEINTLDTPDEYALYRISPNEDEAGSSRELVIQIDDLANTGKSEIHLADEPIDPNYPMEATNVQTLSASETDSEELRIVQDGDLEDGNDRYVLVTADIPTTYRLFARSQGSLVGVVSSDIDPEYMDEVEIPTNRDEGEVSINIIETNDPVDAGEHLEVTAGIENRTPSQIEQEVRLKIGQDEEQVFSKTVTADPGETVTQILGYETAEVEQDVEFPVKVETDDDSDTTTVTVHGTSESNTGGTPEVSTVSASSLEETPRYVEFIGEINNVPPDASIEVGFEYADYNDQWRQTETNEISSQEAGEFTITEKMPYIGWGFPYRAVATVETGSGTNQYTGGRDTVSVPNFINTIDVRTVDVEVEGTAVTVHGEVFDFGKATTVTANAEISTDGFSTATSKTGGVELSNDESGRYSFEFDGLEPDTTYEARCFVRLPVGPASERTRGSPISFTTDGGEPVSDEEEPEENVTEEPVDPTTQNGNDSNDSGTTGDVNSDGDGVTDAEERELGTNPDNPDTDGDLYWDGDEVETGTDPLDPEDYPIRDSDGDGYTDQEEVAAGTDTRDPNDYPE